MKIEFKCRDYAEVIDDYSESFYENPIELKPDGNNLLIVTDFRMVIPELHASFREAIWIDTRYPDDGENAYVTYAEDEKDPQKFLSFLTGGMAYAVLDAATTAGFPTGHDDILNLDCYIDTIEMQTPPKLRKPKKSAVKKPKVVFERVPGKRAAFIVFQRGELFYTERRGGYIWAPLANRAGRKQFHWETLTDVRKGDVIFHSCDGRIRAISIAEDACFECAQPTLLAQENLWERNGRRVNCRYYDLAFPIRTANFKDDLIRASSQPYAPFNSKGRGNQGYLFHLDRDLAKIFLDATLKANPELEDAEFVEL